MQQSIVQRIRKTACLQPTQWASSVFPAEKDIDAAIYYRARLFIEGDKGTSQRRPAI